MCVGVCWGILIVCCFEWFWCVRLMIRWRLWMGRGCVCFREWIVLLFELVMIMGCCWSFVIVVVEGILSLWCWDGMLLGRLNFFKTFWRDRASTRRRRWWEVVDWVWIEMFLWWLCLWVLLVSVWWLCLDLWWVFVGDGLLRRWNARISTSAISGCFSRNILNMMLLCICELWIMNNLFWCCFFLVLWL